MDKFDNIKKEAPILFGLQKNNILKVPKNYFESLPKELMLIPNMPKEYSSINWKVYISSIAAILVFLFIGIQRYEKMNQRYTSFDKTYNELIAANFEIEFSNDDIDVYIDFQDDEALDFFLQELDKPKEKINITKEDFMNFFETEIDYY